MSEQSCVVPPTARKRRRTAICEALLDQNSINFLNDAKRLYATGGLTASQQRTIAPLYVESLLTRGALFDLNTTRVNAFEIDPVQAASKMISHYAESLPGDAMFGTLVHELVVSALDGYSKFRHTRDIFPETPPYHNFTHAVDVSQMTNFILATTEAANLLSPTQKVALIIAALCHDMGHGGFSNRYLGLTQDPLVSEFGPDGTLERMHAKHALELLASSTLITALPDGQRPAFLSQVEACILATDMAIHKNILSAFESRSADGVFVLPISSDEANASESGVLMPPTPPPHAPEQCAAQLRDDDALLLMQLIIKCSDISNVARPFDIAHLWVEKLEAEFFAQGDAEAAAGFEVSFLCNRHRDTDRGKNNIGFIDFIAGPAFRALAGALPKAAVLEHQVVENREKWGEYTRRNT